MRCLLILSATLCVAQPWWTNPFIRYPSFLRQASFEARAAFADICKNGTLTRAQREDALDKWAAQYNLMDAYNSYKNTTERARANRQLAVMRGLDELQKFFTELGKIRVDPNITADQESEAIRKLCESLDRPTRMAVYYLQGCSVLHYSHWLQMELHDRFSGNKPPCRNYNELRRCSVGVEGPLLSHPEQVAQLL
ncbi:hypothetical protein GCK32_012931 [Trichostrongylus colubriformis]|uniref:SXP/RAL-2 family protein Ani s 5-like cation-binding domain-containing protein n=1 Tax=Trichostrongylus colubriformis TaxID=6319 RepID=A0AAN8IM11_TRICO